MVNQRIYITGKDLMILTGKSSSACYRKLELIKITLGKTPKQPLTFLEYCKYEGVDIAEVKQCLQLK